MSLHFFLPVVHSVFDYGQHRDKISVSRDKELVLGVYTKAWLQLFVEGALTLGDSFSSC